MRGRGKGGDLGLVRGARARELDGTTSFGCGLLRTGVTDRERERDGGATRRRSFGEQTEHDLSEQVLPVLGLRAVGLARLCSREERSRGDRLRARGLRGRGLWGLRGLGLLGLLGWPLLLGSPLPPT